MAACKRRVKMANAKLTAAKRTAQTWANKEDPLARRPELERRLATATQAATRLVRLPIIALLRPC